LHEIHLLVAAVGTWQWRFGGLHAAAMSCTCVACVLGLEAHGGGGALSLHMWMLRRNKHSQVALVAGLSVCIIVLRCSR